jgi:hypothetical protein
MKRDLHIESQTRLLREEEKRVEYARQIQERLNDREETREEEEFRGMEEMWRIFKKTVNTTVYEVCRLTTIGNKRRRTRWWNGNVKGKIKWRNEMYKH